MYNRILKRPMFKRGGPSYQAQGTGITSPFDTPRPTYYNGGSIGGGTIQGNPMGNRTGFNQPRGEWAKKVQEKFADPRGDLSYGVQGFSALANPYKESGEAKMLSEMLWEGAQGVRASREKGRELEQKGEMAILESDLQKIITDEDRAWKEAQAEIEHQRKLEEIQKKSELGVDVYKDLHPEKRYDFYINKWRSDVKAQHQGGGLFTHPGWKIASKNIPTFVEGEIEVRNAKKGAGDKRGKIVHPEEYKEDGSVDLTLLSGNIVYFDSMSRSWFTVNNPGPSATPNFVASFTDGLLDLKDDQNLQSEGEDEDSGEKQNKKAKEQKSATELANPYTKEDWEEAAAEGTEKLLDRFKLKGDITEGQSNRYIQNNKDTQIGELQNWWQNTIANDKG